MQKARWSFLALFAALVVAILALGGAALAKQEGTTVFPSATAQTQGSEKQLQVEKPGSGNLGPLSATQKLAIKQGYLVPDQHAYEQAKAAAQRPALRRDPRFRSGRQLLRHFRARLFQCRSPGGD